MDESKLLSSSTPKFSVVPMEPAIERLNTLDVSGTDEKGNVWSWSTFRKTILIILFFAVVAIVVMLTFPSIVYKSQLNIDETQGLYSPPEQGDEQLNHIDSNASATVSNEMIPLCPHVLLLSAPRHGSTWFLDNVEQCKYSRAEHDDRHGKQKIGTFGDLNRHAELWNDAQDGPLKRIPVQDVSDYLLRNHSIKVFPYVWNTHKPLLKTILDQVAFQSTPMIVLLRKPDEAYRSWLTALQTDVWNVNTNTSISSPLPNTTFDSSTPLEEEQRSHADEKGYAQMLGKFFQEVQTYLDQHAYPYDLFWYEQITEQAVIRLNSMSCIIHNCNFNRSQ